VWSTFAQLLNEVIPDDFHVQTYRDAMEADKVISANVINLAGDGMQDAHSMTKDFIEVPDFPTRLKAADSVAKLKGLVQERTVHGFDDSATELMVSTLPPEFADAVRKKLLELAKK